MNPTVNVVATVAAFLTTAASAFLSRILATRLKQYRYVVTIRGEKANDEAVTNERLEEARARLHREENTATWNRRASTQLAIGQYIVGGILATSFVQNSLSRELVGALGVIVLLSSLIHQRFRPDVRARGAQGRAATLRALIRAAEDDIAAVRSEAPDAPSNYEIRQRISQALSEVEASELKDIDTLLGAQHGLPPRRGRA